MPGELPRLRGLDLFITFTAQKGQGKYFNCPLIVNGEPKASRTPYITDELTNYALEFISRPRQNPFCLYLSHKAVHHPWQPPPDLKDLYEANHPPFPREYHPLLFFSGGNLFEGLIGSPRKLYKNYARVVTSMDRQIGRLLKRLDQLAVTENTVIIFTSDNGFFWGEHQLGGTGRWPYEESIRIPFIIKAPNILAQPGRRATQMVLNIDLAPSVLELAGLAVPDYMEGESLVPILKSPSSRGRQAWFYEYQKDFPFRTPTTHAVRTEEYMYIEFEGRKGRELYNIQKDPRQRKNLIPSAEYRQRADQLKKLLENFKNNSRNIN